MSVADFQQILTQYLRYSLKLLNYKVIKVILESRKRGLACLTIAITTTVFLYSQAHGTHANNPPGPNMTNLPMQQRPEANPINMLCKSKEVQMDLELTPKQLRELKQMELNFRTKLHELSHKKNTEDNKRQTLKHINLGREGINRILTPKQISRLKQILLQINGPCSLLNDQHLSQDFGLTTEQQQKMSHMCSDWSQNVKEIEGDKNPSGEGGSKNDPASIRLMHIKINKLQNNFNKKVLGLFSDEQRVLYKKYLGARVKLKPIGPPSLDSNR